jgi:hypothetical protein
MAPSMTWGIAAISVSDQIEKYGAYAGLAAIVGLAVLSLLYFAQAREVKRLREWAGRAPERAAELEARVAADASRRTTVGAAPQTAAAQAATGNVSPASPVAAPGAAKPAVPGAPAETPAEAKPAAAPVTGLPIPVPAAGAPGAEPAPAAGAGATETAKPEDGKAPATPAPATPAGTNGVTGTPPAAGPRVPGRPPPTSAPPVPPAAAATSGPDPDAETDADSEPSPATRALRGGPPSRTLPPRDGTESGHTPSRRTLGVLGGAALVVIAVIVVLVLTLGGGDDSPTPPNQVADTVARTATAEPGRTQSTRQARIDRADTPVIVLNATGVNGLARQVADRLQSTGYQAAVDNSTSRPETLIGYKSGADAAAKEIGRLLDVPSGQIQPMPQDLVGQAGNNAVIVVIGADKASD